ncbi:hypothetical protein ACHAXR_012977 [Thalassiosira sp. AJA248-18]
MRKQSPASSGLLPASYSRRRHGRSGANSGAAADGGSSYYPDGGGGTSSYHDPAATTTYGDGDNVDHTISPRSRSRKNRKPLYTLACMDNNGKLSDDSEEENDRHRSNANASSSRTDAYEQGYEDVLDKPLKLSDFLINDRCYQKYKMEGKRRSYRGIGGRNSTISSDNNKGFMDPQFLAKVCAGASFVGMLFLIFVAIVMETQPLYIKGVSVKSSSSNNDDGTYRFRKETSNALKAAAAYFLTMVFSLIYLQAKELNLELNPAIGRICHLRRLVVSSYFRYRRRHYEDIPDGQHTSSFSSVSAAGSILPMHSSGNGEEKKSRRRKTRKSRRHKDNEGGGDNGSSGSGGAVGGFGGRIKSWMMGGGSSRTGRKKDR